MLKKRIKAYNKRNKTKERENHDDAAGKANTGSNIEKVDEFKSHKLTLNLNKPPIALESVSPNLTKNKRKAMNCERKGPNILPTQPK